MAKYPKQGFKTWAKARELRNTFFKELYESREKGGIYIAGSGASLLAVPFGLGWDVYFLTGETYGASIGYEPEFSRQCLAATAKAGYADDLCSYMRNYWGSALLHKTILGDGTIVDGWRKADFIFSYHQCCMHAPWYRRLAEIEGGDVPLLVYDNPNAWHSRPSPQSWKNCIDYITTQIMELIPQMEKITGRKFDDERMIEAIKNECETSYLWADAVTYQKAIPAPLHERTCYIFHGLTALRPMDRRCTELIKEFRDEMKDRAEKGIADVENEQFRIIHDANPPWAYLGFLRDLASIWGVVSLGALYTWGLHAAWDIDKQGNLIPLKSPHESGIPMRTREEAIRAYLEFKLKFLGQYHLMLNAQTKSELMIKVVKQWKADAVIIHLNRGCEGIAVGQMENRLALIEAGIPVLTYEGDMSDASHFDPVRTREKVEAFLESFGLKKVAS